MRVRIMSLGIAGVATAGLLAGCGGEPEPVAAPPVAPPIEAVSSTPEPAVEPSTPAAAPTPVAAEPGTEFKIGERAVVRVRSGGMFAVVGITVTAIEPADRDLFAQALGSKIKADKRDPYNVRYTIENLGGIEPFRILTPLLDIAGPDGASASAPGRLVFLRPMQGCEHVRPTESSFAQVGATIETCRVRAAPKGTPVTGVRYDDAEGGYLDRPLIWNR
ncbi:hypothetical protein LO762_21240 [Actinocorallia sp. API 0066]|uniref:hypothetical protein n=1 Tax=Actinocorallia sp. API 0066 TaxID=2896846 RepID=UPI001E4B531B|nr:hypothetical protein [Actinocorallia sp. API 0066]MCD0451701.1 hypothetical protein [Actinocorallia sp. API 0066]